MSFFKEENQERKRNSLCTPISSQNTVRNSANTASDYTGGVNKVQTAMKNNNNANLQAGSLTMYRHLTDGEKTHIKPMGDNNNNTKHSNVLFEQGSKTQTFFYAKFCDEIDTNETKIRLAPFTELYTDKEEARNRLVGNTFFGQRPLYIIYELSISQFQRGAMKADFVNNSKESALLTQVEDGSKYPDIAIIDIYEYQFSELKTIKNTGIHHSVQTRQNDNQINKPTL